MLLFSLEPFQLGAVKASTSEGFRIISVTSTNAKCFRAGLVCRHMQVNQAANSEWWTYIYYSTYVLKGSEPKVCLCMEVVQL